MAAGDDRELSEGEMALRIAEDAKLRQMHDEAMAKLKAKLDTTGMQRELAKLEELQEAEERERKAAALARARERKQEQEAEGEAEAPTAVASALARSDHDRWVAKARAGAIALLVAATVSVAVFLVRRVTSAGEGGRAATPTAAADRADPTAPSATPLPNAGTTAAASSEPVLSRDPSASPAQKQPPAAISSPAPMGGMQASAAKRTTTAAPSESSSPVLVSPTARKSRPKKGDAPFLVPIDPR